MEDYKEKLRALVLKFFAPIRGTGEADLMTTRQVYNMVTSILPSEPISEHDVYEVLTNESFEIVREDKELFWVMNVL